MTALPIPARPVIEPRISAPKETPQLCLILLYSWGLQLETCIDDNEGRYFPSPDRSERVSPGLRMSVAKTLILISKIGMLATVMG